MGLRVSESYDSFIIIAILGFISYILFVGVLFINIRVLRSMMHATHGSATSMDRIWIHGNRYLFMVLFYRSHGQISTNRMYLPMDIGDIHGASTKSMEKQSNMPPLPASFPTPFPHQSGYTNHAICESFRRHCESDIGAFFSCWFDHSMWGFLNI